MLCCFGVEFHVVVFGLSLWLNIIKNEVNRLRDTRTKGEKRLVSSFAGMTEFLGDHTQFLYYPHTATSAFLVSSLGIKTLWQCESATLSTICFISLLQLISQVMAAAGNDRARAAHLMAV